MARFELFLPVLLGFEGGYVDDPDDPGGETNKGITMAVFRECSHHLLGLEPTSENLRAMTDAQAGIIYQTRYWNAVQGDSFNLQELANIVCDFYVNAGTHATTLLQRTLNGMGGKLVVDGKIGPAAIRLLNDIDQIAAYRHYKLGRLDYYQRLGQRYPKFVQGWLKRVKAFPEL